MIPNMVLTAPANEIEVKLALEFALGADKPVVIRYPKDLVPLQKFVRTACARPFELGKSILVRKGRNSALAIVSYGSVLTEAMGAAELLAKDGIAVDVINARFAAPVDEKIISLLEQGKRIITVEDHTVSCGFGSAVLELAATKSAARLADKLVDSNLSTKGYIPDAIRILGAPRRFIGHNYRNAQLIEAGINADNIVQTAKNMLKM